LSVNSRRQTQFRGFADIPSLITSDMINATFSTAAARK
jgi:hypothetical protein